MRIYGQQKLWSHVSFVSIATSAAIVTAVLFATSTGCKSSSTEPTNSGSISMTSQYSPSNSPAEMFDTQPQFRTAGGSAAIDSITISRARFVIRDIKYKTQSDSANFRSLPFVWELNLTSAVQDFSVAGVPFGSYRKIEFDVHRINVNDVTPLPASEQAQFVDFLVGDRYSIIVNGMTYTSGVPTAFTFRSRINVKQKIDLAPEMVVSEPAPSVNATMLVSSGGWFTSSGGGLLDPADSLNENSISDNMRASIKVFKDNNKDGSKDLN